MGGSRVFVQHDAIQAAGAAFSRTLSDIADSASKKLSMADSADFECNQNEERRRNAPELVDSRDVGARIEREVHVQCAAQRE
jgi:hypothetical protein